MNLKELKKVLEKHEYLNISNNNGKTTIKLGLPIEQVVTINTRADCRDGVFRKTELEVKTGDDDNITSLHLSGRFKTNPEGEVFVILYVDSGKERYIKLYNSLDEHKISEYLLHNSEFKKFKEQGRTQEELLEWIKNQEKTPFFYDKNTSFGIYKGTPHSLNYGFELEFQEVGTQRGSCAKLNKLQEAFGVTNRESENHTINIGGGHVISIQSDNYGGLKDVVKIYNDMSVGYEIVTRPLSLPEIETKLEEVYKTTRSIMKADYETIAAGGHITIMDGQHMNKPMNKLVMFNFIQIHRLFYNSILKIGTHNSYIRGTKFMKYNTNQSASEYVKGDKYDAINKRRDEKTQEYIGVEARYFSSPPSPKIAEENARIVTALWRMAERISAGDSKIRIKQWVHNIQSELSKSFSTRKKYSKKELDKFNNKLLGLDEHFLNFIEREARRVNCFYIIKKRLKVRQTKKREFNIEIENEEEIRRIFMNKRIEGIKKEQIIKEIKDSKGKDAAKFASTL